MQKTIFSILICTIAVFCLGCKAPINNASDIKTAQLKNVLDDFEASGGQINGSVLVAHGEDIIFAEGFGVADDKLDQFNNVNTQFLIGSLTKQFTAAVLLRSLYDREKSVNPELTDSELVQHITEILHQPLSYLFPLNDSIWNEKAPKWLDKVTLHHLLCHSSGIPNFTEEPTFVEFSKADHASIHEVVALFKDTDLEFTPGESFNYSNSNYILLGIAVERISGLSLDVALSSFFFEPLGMTSTVFLKRGRIPELKETYPNLARGYCWDIFEKNVPLTETTNYEEMLHPYGAGAIMSTVVDLHRWNMALYENFEVLPKIFVELMTKKHNEHEGGVFYGYGLFIESYPFLCFCHSGSIIGYRGELCYYPSQHVTVALLSNASEKIDQYIEIEKDVLEQFGYSEKTEEAESYVREKYPLLFEQSIRHNFAAPIIEFLEGND